MKGLYAETRVFEISFPIVMGWAGSGTVISSGGGFMANRVLGKRVSCGMSMKGRKMITGGTYQQYMVCDALQAMPLEEDMSFEEGANVLVNPFTAVGLVDRVQELKS